MSRDDFSATIKKKLQMRAALICSNPNCRRQTVAPATLDSENFVCLGKAAHIAAASPGGPRYDGSQSPEDRRSINNAIYLCSACADLIDKNNGVDFPAALLDAWKNEHEQWVKANLNKDQSGKGGDGGGGTIIGNRGTVIGGKGGSGGVAGVGGKGGGGHIVGDDALIIGGDGGSAATSDGRGGIGARGPTERFGFSTTLWGFGRGGSSPNHPEFDRRLTLLTQFRKEYGEQFPNDKVFIDAGIDQVPVDWINQRLLESNESWSISKGENGYVLPELSLLKFQN